MKATQILELLTDSLTELRSIVVKCEGDTLPKEFVLALFDSELGFHRELAENWSRAEGQYDEGEEARRRELSEAKEFQAEDLEQRGFPWKSWELPLYGPHPDIPVLFWGFKFFPLKDRAKDRGWRILKFCWGKKWVLCTDLIEAVFDDPDTTTNTLDVALYRLRSTLVDYGIPLNLSRDGDVVRPDPGWPKSKE